MTVCVAVGVYDGIVFATDTAVTTMDHKKPNLVSNVYKHGNKLFNFHRDLPIVAMTSGLASLNDIPLKALAKDFRALMESGKILDVENYAMDDVAIAARKFFFEEHSAQDTIEPAHQLRLWIGGYGSDRRKHEIWSFTIQGKKCEAPVKILSDGSGMGITWFTPGPGINDPIGRLLLGYCDNIERRLLKDGFDDRAVRALFAGSEVALWEPGMPIQDAIDLAKYLVDLTKQYFRFLPGADIVGGDTDIAVVTRHEGFKWIQRKHFYDAALNPPRKPAT